MNMLTKNGISKKSKDYLDKHLLPLFEDIKVKPSESEIFLALGIPERVSSQSVSIQIGNKLETFWNSVISESKVTENLIEDSNLITNEGELTPTGRQSQKQIDGCFKIGNTIYYREFKCNLTFDSEKKPASEEKLSRISELLFSKYQDIKVDSGYFVPMIKNPSKEWGSKLRDKNISVEGYGWLVDLLQTHDLFTADEFEYYFRTVLGPVIEKKVNS